MRLPQGLSAAHFEIAGWNSEHAVRSDEKVSFVATCELPIDGQLEVPGCVSSRAWLAVGRGTGQARRRTQAPRLTVAAGTGHRNPAGSAPDRASQAL